MNACEERSQRNQNTAQRASGPASTNIRRLAHSAAAAKARRARMYGAAVGLGVLVVFFIIIGIVVKIHGDSNSGKDQNRTQCSGGPRICPGGVDLVEVRGALTPEAVTF